MSVRAHLPPAIHSPLVVARRQALAEARRRRRLHRRDFSRILLAASLAALAGLAGAALLAALC